MKQKLLFLLMALCFGFVSGAKAADFVSALSTPTGTVALTDNSSLFWQYHSMEYVVPDGITYTVEMKNYTVGSGNFQNFNVVINNGTASYSGGTEYLYLRNDNYGWGTYYDAEKITTTFTNNNPNKFSDNGVDNYWAAYRDAMNGAHVKLSVTRSGTSFSVSATITPTNTTFYPEFTYNYASTTVEGMSALGFTLTIEGGHLDIIKAYPSNYKAAVDAEYAYIQTHSENRCVPVTYTSFYNGTLAQSYWAGAADAMAEEAQTWAISNLNSYIAGADYTLCIKNGGFETGSKQGWSVVGESSGASGIDKTGGIESTYVISGAYHYYTGFWGQNISQSISTLPVGRYRLSAKIGSWGATCAIFANGVISGTKTFNSVLPITVDFEVSGEEGDIIIGSAGTFGASSPYADGGSWGYRVDDFEIHAISALEVAQEEYVTALSTANSVVTNVGSNYGGVFQHTTATYEALTTAISDNDNIDSEVVSDYTDATDALNTAVTNFNNSITLPEAEKYYRIYLAVNGSKVALNLNATKSASQQVVVNGEPYPIKFRQDGTTGRYNFIDGNGYTLSRDNGSSRNLGYYTNNVRGASMSYVINDNGTVSFSGYMNSTSSYRVGINSNSAVSGTSVILPTYSGNLDQWIVEEATTSNATLQVSKTAKMGTFCAPFAVAIPSGVTASEASMTNSDWVHLEDIEDGVIPARTAVILSAPNLSDETLSKTFVGIATEDDDDFGVLKGLYTAQVLESGTNPYYIMQYYDGETSFFCVPTGQSRNLGANRCYLLPESGNTPARITIGGKEEDPTAINEMKAIESEAKVMKDGKYLVKGRIVVVKNGKVYSANGQILK